MLENRTFRPGRLEESERKRYYRVERRFDGAHGAGDMVRRLLRAHSE